MQHGFMQYLCQINNAQQGTHFQSFNLEALPPDVASLQQEANGHNDYPTPHFQQSLGTFGIRMPADAAEPKFPLMHSEKHAVPARRPSAWHTIPDSTWRRCYESLLKYCHVFFIVFFGGGLSPWLLTQQRHDPRFISPDVVSIRICQVDGVIAAYRNLQDTYC